MPHSSSAKSKPQSLEAQLDELLEQIRTIEPGAVPDDEPQAQAVETHVDAESVTEPVAPRQTGPTAAVTTSDQASGAPSPAAPQRDADAIAAIAAELARQAQTQRAAAASTSTSTAPPTPAQPTEPTPAATVKADESAGDSDDDLAAQIQSMLDHAQDAAVTEHSAPPAAAPARPADEVTIEQIDEMLASEVAAEAQDADDGEVQGQFESVQDLLGQDVPTADSVAAASSPTAPPASSPTEPVVTAPDATKGQDDGDVDGAFATPEELLTTSAQAGPHPAGAPGSAAAVAHELDNQPEQAATHAVADEEQQRQTVAQGTQLSSPGRANRIVTCERALRRLCAALNRPLEAVSPSTRSLIGLVGLLTAFNGSVMLIYGLLKALL